MFGRDTDAALRAGDADAARAEYRRALALWRGGALEDVPLGRTLRADADALTEAHVRAREGRLEALLLAGDVAGAAHGLRLLLADHPLREPAWGLLVRAHSAAGERAAALNAYQQARSTLAEELGLEPGAELQGLHEAILAGSADAPVSPAAVMRDRAAPMPQQLPPAPEALVGRDRELDRVRTVLARPGGWAGPRTETPEAWPPGPALVGIHGVGGTGKSALAVAAAHGAADAYPDGQLYVDLQGTSPGLPPLEPAEVLGRFLRALHVAERMISPDTAEAAAWFRSVTARRRLLIVLDNAVDCDQVRPLLPAGGGCAVVVTGRDELSALEGLTRLRLGQLATGAAVDLLRRFIGPEPIDRQPEVAREIAALCGRLPLAVRVIGVRFAEVPAWRLPDLAERLRNERFRLDELGMENLDVRSTFDIGYRALLTGEPRGEAAARLFRRLGLLSFSEITPFAAAALVDTDEMSAYRLLGSLVRYGLLERDGTVYRMHDLLRLFATELARDEEEPAATTLSLIRVARRYIELISANPVLRLPRADDPPTGELPGPRTVAEGNTWVGGHIAPLNALVRQLARSPAQLPLARELLHVLHRRLVVFHPAECIRLYRPVLEGAERDGDRGLAAEVLCILSNAHLSLHRYDDMAACAYAALRRLPESGHDRARARVLAVVGAAEVRLGALASAAERLAAALALQEGAQRWKAVGVISHDIARAAILRGDHGEGLRLLHRSLALNRGHGDLLDACRIHDSLAWAHLRAGRPDSAVGHADAAAELAERTGHVPWRARALQWRGLARHAQGDTAAAVSDAWQAEALCRDTEIPPVRIDALRILGAVLRMCGDPRAEGVLAEADALAQPPDAP
ncbi:AfsR/SARP family transcriptional regulator [Streptomonospora wellingtoniae]|uniref:BTAD domain-containing putative transcriptional regulator n=1 Tax=Streptomonospora wellingtoniae TaxID=3075544 RepID=A0ABU2KNW6_9ACTN|nr:BTAD domain-containing putative transcriptional regulator [Streptomonospora sp. DSM 45055]MDT0300962.1 BTAD domain-containing putative transcriptional regulator [Streptomonospora sp. DSM 45055]